MNTIADKNIIELFASDRKEAGFRLLMKTYQEPLYYAIRRMVHSHHDTDDVLQNALIKIYRYLPDFKENSKLFTWLYRIAVNESLTFLKRKNRRMEDSIDKNLELFGQELKADQYFDGDDWAIELKKAIETLPNKQKLVFNMRYYDEMSYKQMSEVLDTSEGALKASYHHAAKKIEEYLSKDV